MSSVSPREMWPVAAALVAAKKAHAVFYREKYEFYNSIC